MHSLKIPISIISFNRPGYLEQFLLSLKAQTIDMGMFEVNLFQDGYYNDFSKREKCSDETISECISVFKRIFPAGNLHLADRNVGIAVNIDRAERYAFQDSKADYGIFFEDDLTLSPNYLQCLMTLKGLMKSHSEIAYAACYGLHKAPLEVQKANARGLVELGHNWGFILSKEAWLQTTDLRSQYMDVIKGVDYTQRDHAKIRELYRSWGCNCDVTSQDAAKNLIYITKGFIKVNTVAVFGKYIGEKGVHSSTDLYSSEGYQNTVLYDGGVPESFEYSDKTKDQINKALRRFAGLS